jgi:hypothetical protein
MTRSHNEMEWKGWTVEVMEGDRRVGKSLFRCLNCEPSVPN